MLSAEEWIRRAKQEGFSAWVERWQYYEDEPGCLTITKTVVKEADFLRADQAKWAIIKAGQDLLDAVPREDANIGVWSKDITLHGVSLVEVTVSIKEVDGDFLDPIGPLVKDTRDVAERRLGLHGR